MRIGLIAPPWLPVPPPAYGGTETVVDNLARGLSRLGHEVRLFTVGEATSPVERLHFFDRQQPAIGQTVPEAAHVLAAYDALQDVDIIHDHTLLGPILGATPDGPPVVCTNHGPFTRTTRPIFARIARSAAVVAISADQARRSGDVPITAVIHHGIDLDAYQPGSGSGGYVAFVGRMSPDKGVHRAVQVAKDAGWPIRIVSKMREPDEIAYFTEAVRPLLTAGDEPPEELAFAERLAVVQGAAALVNPIAWPEPFGLVMAESLAAATPVIAAPCGAAPEIVDHGTTGLLCTTPEEWSTAVLRAASLDRTACRAAAEDRFSIDRMARDHVALYESLLEGRNVAVLRARGLDTVVYDQPPAHLSAV